MIFAYVNMKISHPENLEKYREKAGQALSKHGGAVVAAGKNCQLLEGSTTVPDVAAILSFPDSNCAQAWIRDPDLGDIHKLRRSSGEVSIILIE